MFIDKTHTKCHSNQDNMYSFLICDKNIDLNQFPDLVIYLNNNNNNKFRLRWMSIFRMKEEDNEEREYASSIVIHLSDEDREPRIIETPAFKSI